MLIQCAWCRGVIADGVGDVSHGICNTCFAKIIEHRQATPEEYQVTQARVPDEVVENIEVWHELQYTLCQNARGCWAFDCRMSGYMVLTHYEENLR